MAKIEDYRVQPNQDVIVAGKLVYSSLLTRQESKGNFPREEFVAVIENPQITKGQNTELGQYVAASCYTSNKTGALTLRAASHGPQNIRVFDRTVRDPAGVKLTNELAPDQPVELAIHSFKNANYTNVGVALNAICIQDANNIKYLSNAPSLSLFGLSSNGQAPQAQAQNPAPTGYPQAPQAPTGQAPQAQNPVPNAYPQAPQAPTYPQQAPTGQAPQAQAQNPAPTGYQQAPQAQQNPLMGGTAPTGTPAGQTASTDPFGAFRPQNGQAPTGQTPTGQAASADPFGAFRPQGGQAPTGQTPNGQGQNPGNPF
jgi:hypothetical protein